MTMGYGVSEAAEVDFRQYIHFRLPPTPVFPMFSRRKLAEVVGGSSPPIPPPIPHGGSGRFGDRPPPGGIAATTTYTRPE